MRFIRLEECNEGMVTAKSIYGNNGTILLQIGAPLKTKEIESLQKLGYPGVYIEDGFSNDIDVPDIVDSLTYNELKQAAKALFEECKPTGVTNPDEIIDKNEITGIIKKVETPFQKAIDQIIEKRSQAVNITGIRTFESYTYQHCLDVCILSILLGDELGLPRNELETLGKAALFHDIGKMSVPKTILEKPTDLAPSEFAEIKKHAQKGHDFLKKAFPDEICTSVLYHHEKYDGSGYPNGIAGDNIPLYAKIISVANVYDAIISKRVHKIPNVAEAHEYIRDNAKIHFDPKIVEVFLCKVPPFPAGSSVALSNGRKALVVENRLNNLTRPLVKLIDKALRSDGVYIDMAQDNNARSIAITGLI